MNIYIKNMVCERCITAVSGIFNEINIDVKSISLGEVETSPDVPEEKLCSWKNYWKKQVLKGLKILPARLLKN